MFGIGTFLVFSAIAIVLLGWLVPVYVLPEANRSEWMALIPVVAKHYLPFVFARRARLRRALVGADLGCQTRAPAPLAPRDVSRSRTAPLVAVTAGARSGQAVSCVGERAEHLGAVHRCRRRRA